MFAVRLHTKPLVWMLATCLLAGVVHAQRGALVRPGNLAELVDQSAVVIRGHVISAVVQPHPELTNIPTVLVSVKVERSLKGSAKGIYTFRSFIWDARDKADAAGYRKGDEVLLLINPRTQYGLQSTAGLDQGRFLIERDATGNAVVASRKATSFLFRDLPKIADKRGVRFSARAEGALSGKADVITLGALEDMIVALAGGQQ